MAEDPGLPVAIRITRPYATEDEFLEQELETLTRTTITLVGAQPRPQGVILRFELVLSSGQVLLRGEGRVIAFKPNVVRGSGGLALRFTRLDTRSKALVDRAAVFRERRRSAQNPGSGPTLPAEPSAPDLPFAPEISSSPALAAADYPPSSPVLPMPVDALQPPSSPVLRKPVEALQPTPSIGHARPRAISGEFAMGALPPPDREALLERLRVRARALGDAEVQRILQSRRRG